MRRGDQRRHPAQRHPREARASLLVPASVADFQAWWTLYAGIYQEQAGRHRANLTVLLTAGETGPAHERVPAKPLLDALMACPNGVMRMSDAIPGVTETSTSLGVIKTLEEVYVRCLIRSLIDSGRGTSSR